MRTLLFLLLLSFTLNAQEGVKKVVFELANGNIEVFEKKVLSAIAFHKSYYENNLEELEVAVVIHGDAYKFFLKDLSKSRYKNDKELSKKHKEFAKRLESLANIYDVEFLMCASGIKRLEIDKENIYDFVKLAATSTVALIDKQSDGFAYILVF